MPDQKQNFVVLVAKENEIGTAGFVVSIVSLFCCGVTSPIGFVLSLIGLCWAPRGMAMSGTILGAIGSVWIFSLLAGAVSLPDELGHATEEEAQPSLADDPKLIATPQDKPRQDGKPPKPPAPKYPRKTMEKFRTWTSIGGTFQTDADFVSSNGKSVKLRKASGELLTFPVERLSDVDREWIKAYSKTVD